jgi:o-succinylbenzoate synthase
MRIKAIELRIIQLPLVRPFRTSFGTQTSREVLIVKVVNENGTTGWAECVAMSEPLYSPEYTHACIDLIKRFLLPALKKAGDFKAEEVATILKPFLGGQMAKAALETAILDAQLRDEKRSLAAYLGATKSRVKCGVSVGIANNLDALI